MFEKKANLRLYCKSMPLSERKAVDIYESLVGDDAGFILESYDEGYDRFTIIGAKPVSYVSSRGMSLVITDTRDGSECIIEGNPRDSLKNLVKDIRLEKPDDFEGFSGGLAGCLGYDFIRYTESFPDDNPDPIDIETVQLFLVMKYIMLDQKKKLIYAVVIDDDKPSHEEAAYAECIEMLERVSKAGAQPEKEFIPDGRVTDHTDDLDSYTKKVEKIKHYIKEGHIFQTVLSQRWVMESGCDGFFLYRELRRLNPSPYLYYFNFKNKDDEKSFEVIGSSPELIVKRKGDVVFTCPIAGTRKRGADKNEDERLKKELLSDEKELCEHVMLVDLARNDMGRIAEFGSVKVSEFEVIKEYSHVMHIVSLVEGKVENSFDAVDLLSSFLPAGTLSGAPKIRAMEIIDELESVRRGLYGGATGYMDFSGDMDFCITIRTIVKKNNKCFVQAGAGIVADSVPEKEYMECANKAMAMASVILKNTDEMLFL